ncbi:Ig-like domain-containing protein [Microbacterium sp. MPKO10]|uniref:Ig-like domain-containing protein n=1 Tax=Microbacterium sp. MPKO10 TaxID=2989818 RepID=UPI00223669F7|nr:Ig-like domain-containing protein [Microbacterium sp. MPKO10]MCW4457531.1 Ig-like domain-containing protein [Microbacterium sp. MPKO10]
MRGWLRGRKVTASVIAASLILAVPVTFAVLHPGYPASDVDLEARDVWVTNGKELLAGRLNKQIEELDASVATLANDIDIFQDGELALLHDRVSSTVQTIDPAYTTLGNSADLPPGAELAYGGGRLAVLEPESGSLWVTNVAGGLDFTTVDNEPLLKLGADAAIAVSHEGVVFAAAPADGILYSYPADGGKPSEQEIPSSESFQLTAAGETPVLFDGDANRVIVPGQDPIELPSTGVKLQQSSADPGEALVAGAESLMSVPLNGDEVTEIDADISAPAANPDDVAAPVNLEGCWHAAWASGSRYLAQCDGSAPTREEIDPSTAGAELVFRVNRDVIALNNLQTGDSWLVTENMRLVHNWEDVTPPEEDDGEEGDEKSSVKSFEDTLAERTDQNRPPIANDDKLGVRPERTTVLPLLSNDTDPDGDVLTITDIKGFSEKWGQLQYIDGGRALQFSPKDGVDAGTFSFRYSVSDGRPGGVAEGAVNVTIRPPEANEPPESERVGAAVVDAGQTITYDALADWRDPDGDDIYLESAASDAGDRVRFNPDGRITVTHTSGQLGPRDIVFTVSDGTASETGTFTLDVKPAGSSNPVGTPDFAQTFVGEAVDVHPLDNDLSPSGGQLELLGAEALQGAISVAVDSERGTITASAGKAGAYYVKYSLGAGERTSIGLIRIEVTEKAEADLAPVAVRDTGYVRPGEPAMIPVLVNDVSPTGDVLAVKSIEATGDAAQLSIELLSQSMIRVTATAEVTGQVQFSYTVSDGHKESTTTVTIVMVPPLSKHQAPIAEDDQVRVRAGDIASVPVLDNDIHPDNAGMTVEQELVQGTEKGLAFVTDDRVRYQAPAEAGVYTAVYTVVDDYGQKATASVTFTVVGTDEDSNQAPIAKTLTTRVFEGSSVDIEIPLDGLDPDGDSVVYDGLASAPLLGAVRNEKSQSFTYVAGSMELGTDTFTYKIKDVLGATAVGTIKIAVIPRPEQAMNPVAVDDSIEVKPGRVASVPVLKNDSDPNQYSMSLDEELEDVPEDVVATVEGESVVIEAPDVEMTFALRYTVRNEKGGFDSAYVMVRVSEEATIQPPGVQDQVVEQEDVVGEETVDIDIFDGATNPGGRVSDLTATLEGPNADQAKILENGKVRVTLGDKRMAITFRLTNEADDLSSAAFIVVPPYSDGQPPRLREDLAEQIVDMNSTKEWDLDDIAYSPSGKDISITGADNVSASRSNGESSFVDEKTLRFSPAEDYRGPASITFEVTDGTSTGTSLLVLPITVGDPNFEDIAPTFTPPSITIEAGEDAVEFDLRSAASHPNPDVLNQVTFSDLRGQDNGIQAKLSGSTLSVQAPFKTPTGTSVTLGVSMKFKDFTVDGQITVTVVASTRPMPAAVDHVNNDARKGETYTIKALAGAFNPFPDEKLTIVKAELDSGDAKVSTDGTTVTVKTGPAKSQEISIIYTIQDATGDQHRQSSARITVVVKDVPDAPPAPKAAPSDSNVRVTFNGTPANNGSDVTKYTVRRSDGTERTNCSPGTACDFPSDNGKSYSFRVKATNGVGDSSWSPESKKVTPWGTPSSPSLKSFTANGSTNGNGKGKAKMTATWSAPSSTGGSAVTYSWNVDGGSEKTTSQLSATTGILSAGTHKFKVRACNNGEKCSDYVSISGKVPQYDPEVTLVKGVDGPKERCWNGKCAQNTYQVHFTWQYFEANTYTVVPQYCDSGEWHDVAPEPYKISMDKSGNETTSAWVQPQLANCGIRVKISGNGVNITSAKYDFPG